MELLRCLFLVLILIAAPLASHDLYILPERFVVMPHQALLAGFHNGDSFPRSEASPVILRVRDTNLLSANGLVAMQDLKIDGKRAIATVTAPEAGEFLLTIRTIPNLLVSTPAQFLSYLKEEGLQHVLDWRVQHGELEQPAKERYSKYAKSLLVAGKTDSFFSHQVGFPIEIIPESDPYLAKPGDGLPVRVVFKGKPAPGLQMEVAWAGHGQNKTTIAGRTDENGSISIKLDKPGLFRLHTLVMERCEDQTIADWESSWASLTFELR